MRATFDVKYNVCRIEGPPYLIEKKSTKHLHRYVRLTKANKLTKIMKTRLQSKVLSLERLQI